MPYIPLILSCFLLGSWSYAQNTFKVVGGNVKAGDGAYLALQNTNWANNSGSPLEVGGNVALRGTAAASMLGGTAPATIFKNLAINKSAGEVHLGSHITIGGGLMDVLSGDVNLNGYVITLDPAATLSETAGNTIKGPAGYILATRGLNAPSADNVAGMGLEIASAANLGHTEVIRSHGAQSAGSNSSILRYFAVAPEFNTGLGASLVFHYDESELNGQAESQLKLFQSDDGGASWTLLNSIVNTNANTVSTAGLNHLSRFTLSAECLEATTQAICQDITVQLDAGGSASITAADIDGGSTGACGQLSLSASQTDFSCADVGNIDVVLMATGGDGASSNCTATLTVEDNTGSCNQVVCIDEEINGLIVYVEGLGLSSSVESAITRRLDLAASKFCIGYSTSSVISSLNYVISYVQYQSGGGIPAAEAAYIIAQVEELIDALNAGIVVCCQAQASAALPVNPGQLVPAEAYELEVYPNPARDEVYVELGTFAGQSVSLVVYNRIGQPVKIIPTGAVEALIQIIKVADLPAGMYLMQVRSGEQVLVKKFMVVD
ncbi:MAG: T9SS type A sorting domain-containing protein [Lewinellaceae bacterium]|nr:T9SS type A sorting domain-containing protein [Lewinellaceae bacterium]